MKYLRLRMYISFRLLRHRLVQAATTRPSGQDWLLAMQLMVLFGAVSIPLALGSGLAQFTVAQLSWQATLLLAVRVLIFPAFLEEGLWRVLLLPHKTERVSDHKRWLLGLPILGLFVVMHPLNGMTLRDDAFGLFTNPVFLTLTALLGLICTLAYWRSGSWWVPMTIHWVIVFVWLMYFGGYAEMHS